MTRQTAFPEYDNGATFDAILARLTPYGFTDSSFANDACPSLCREMAGDIFVMIYVGAIYGPDAAPLDGARITVMQIKGAKYNDIGQFPDIETAIKAALNVCASRPDKAQGATWIKPIETLGDAMAFIRDLESAGLSFHFEDEPDSIVYTSDGTPFFTPAQCVQLTARLANLYALDWGAFDCPIGYALYTAGRMPPA